MKNNYPWLDEFCLSQKGAIKNYQPDWQADCYNIGGKMFAMITSYKDGRPIITLKLAPEHGEVLRQKYTDKIIPGYYMNKVHWNSVFLDNDIPRDLLEKMITEAYTIVLSSLTKKVQAEING
ncbi:MAG: MmcQ/YjbR family DNA-binding protein [Alphaproteobacteria bacterium]|jgi:predicted DNA-binding protein (MmcQ/YjbR family)|nr:MmcQ/YjbR family DNA-binding protein [Alphaproteobacteria bacterium]